MSLKVQKKRLRAKNERLINMCSLMSWKYKHTHVKNIWHFFCFALCWALFGFCCGCCHCRRYTYLGNKTHWMDKFISKTKKKFKQTLDLCECANHTHIHTIAKGRTKERDRKWMKLIMAYVCRGPDGSFLPINETTRSFRREATPKQSFQTAIDSNRKLFCAYILLSVGTEVQERESNWILNLNRKSLQTKIQTEERESNHSKTPYN